MIVRVVITAHCIIYQQTVVKEFPTNFLKMWLSMIYKMLFPFWPSLLHLGNSKRYKSPWFLNQHSDLEDRPMTMYYILI